MWFASSDQAVGFFDKVQDEELREVAASRARRGQPPVADNLVGLAFSGGGIRSATFNLGILQGLAERGFLKQIDFISTVSGGGYIGAWLVAWMRRAGCKPVEERLRQNCQPAPDPGRYLEPDQVRFLRKYSMYLAPRSGLLGADIWTAAAIYLRNLILNLTLLIAFGLAVLLIPDLVLMGILSSPIPTERVLMAILFAAGAGAAAVVGIGMSGLSDDPPKSGWKAVILKHVGSFTAIPLFVLAASGAALMATSLHSADLGWKDYVFGGAAVYFVFWLIASAVSRSATRGKEPLPVERKIAPYWNIGATALSGALAGGLVYGIAKFFAYAHPKQVGELPTLSTQAALLVFAPPLLVVTLMLTAVFHMGFAGRALPDAKREWAARAAAVLGLTTLAYMGLFGATLYGPLAMKWLMSSPWARGYWGKVTKWGLAAAWAAISGGGVLAGKSAATNGKGGNLDSLAKIAPPVFMLGSALLLAFALDSGLTSLARVQANDGQQVISEAPAEVSSGAVADAANQVLSAGNLKQMASAAHALDKALSPDSKVKAPLTQRHFDGVNLYLYCWLWWVLAVCLFVTLLFMWCVDVNEFSMHLFYRNRLVRAYLGASQTCRIPDPFTGFAKDDDVVLADLTMSCRTMRVPVDLARNTELEYEEDQEGHIRYDLPYDGPYPIFCTALNLVRGKELAWQKRKSASFIFTPRFCGYDHFEYHHDPEQKFSAAAYRPTENFSGTGGPRVGTAIAISGAAASPNMGYHTSPALGFMMALFNVRLGWWAGNPRHPRTWRKHGPGWGLLYMLRELFPSTNDETAYVYLSDGGHFENLGIYELVRRKCRYIIASDADCDPGGTFESLGNAVEKCRRDFGVNIDICVDDLRHDPASGLSSSPYVIGKIAYRDAPAGYLLFIKSTLIADLSADVFAYGAQNREFPFDSTGNQFFDESQFESYRSLGQQIMRRIVEKGGEDTPQLAALIESLESMSHAG